MISFGIGLSLLAAIATRVSLEDAQRIVGGKPVDIENFEYQVAINKFGKHLCGGSIIAERFVLSAAHCFPNKNFDGYTIRAGSKYHSKGGHEIEVENVTLHPLYNYPDYDFAILHLAHFEGDYLDKSVITLADEKDELKDGEIAITSGWGATSGKNPNKSSKILRAVEVPIFNREECKDIYSINNSSITDRMFCAGYAEGSKDSCQGDSGGPVKRESDGILIGVVSWGDDCGLPDSPGVYAKVSSVRPWIHVITGV